MKLSTATSVLVNYRLEDAVDQVIGAGFDGIDIWCGRPHLYRKDHSPAELTVLKQKLDDHHRPVVSLMPAFFRYPYSLSSPIDAIRDDSIEYMEDSIDNAVEMGAKHVLVVPSHSLRGQTLEDARRRFISSLEIICNYAANKGVRLGLEIVYPGLSDYMSATDDALDAAQRINYCGLGVVLDSGHLNLSGEDPASALDNLGDLLLQVHVNDNDGKQQQNAIPGEGNFDFARLVSLLRQRRFEGFLTLELAWGYSFDPLPAITEAARRMRATLSEVRKG
jgi:protein FrlC